MSRIISEVWREGILIRPHRVEWVVETTYGGRLVHETWREGILLKPRIVQVEYLS